MKRRKSEKLKQKNEDTDLTRQTFEGYKTATVLQVPKVQNKRS